MLRIDRKQSPEMSFTLWIPTIWMLVSFSKPLSIWFQSGGETMEEGNALDRIYLIVLLCLGLIILVKRKFNWPNAIKENTWLMLLIGYMLFSCLWSDNIFISFKRWIRELVAVVMAFVVATEPHPRKALESILRRTIYILIPLSYILIQYFSEYGRAYVHNAGDLMWIGATIHKNTLAQLCIFAAFFLIWTYIKRRQGRNNPVVKYQTYLEVFILILAFWLLAGPQRTFTYSATANVAFAVGLSVLICLYWMKKLGTILRPIPLIVLTAFIIIYGTVTPMIGELSLIDISSAVGRNESLTGRTDVWRQLVPVAMQQPILGYGFGGFWTTNTRKVFDISGAHNGYLDVIMELGFVGLVLYAIFLLSNIRKAQRVLTQDFDWGALWICYLVMGLLSNITESSLSSFSSQMMSIIILFTVTSTTHFKHPGSLSKRDLRLEGN
jgi:exopolysaccharide production protein ExoQ